MLIRTSPPPLLRLAARASWAAAFFTLGRFYNDPPPTATQTKPKQGWVAELQLSVCVCAVARRRARGRSHPTTLRRYRRTRFMPVHGFIAFSLFTVNEEPLSPKGSCSARRDSRGAPIRAIVRCRGRVVFPSPWAYYNTTGFFYSSGPSPRSRAEPLCSACGAYDEHPHPQQHLTANGST